MNTTRPVRYNISCRSGCAVSTRACNLRPARILRRGTMLPAAPIRSSQSMFPDAQRPAGRTGLAKNCHCDCSANLFGPRATPISGILFGDIFVAENGTDRRKSGVAIGRARNRHLPAVACWTKRALARTMPDSRACDDLARTSSGRSARLRGTLSRIDRWPVNRAGWSEKRLDATFRNQPRNGGNAILPLPC